MDQEPLILASSSPRRKKLLEDTGFKFNIYPANIDEKLLNKEEPENFVLRLAKEKAEFIGLKNKNSFILAADTIISFNNQIIGKPKNLQEAEKTLLKLQNKSHFVITGVAIYHYDHHLLLNWCSKTEVFFKALTKENIQNYFSLVSPLDKAGSYAIQEYGELIIDKINGSLSNVIGLPIEEVTIKLNNLLLKK